MSGKGFGVSLVYGEQQIIVMELLLLMSQLYRCQICGANNTFTHRRSNARLQYITQARRDALFLTQKILDSDNLYNLLNI